MKGQGQKLTKQDLLEQQIEVLMENGEWAIYHTSKKCGKVKLKITPIYQKKMFGKDLVYLKTGWMHNITKKPQCFTLQRILYAWFFGEVPEGYDVDHIDGNTLNNSLDNYRLLTRSENVKKRKTAGNQHTALKQYKKEF